MVKYRMIELKQNSSIIGNNPNEEEILDYLEFFLMVINNESKDNTSPHGDSY